MNINTVSVSLPLCIPSSIPTMREHGIEGSNAFSGTFMLTRGDDRHSNATVMAKAELALTPVLHALNDKNNNNDKVSINLYNHSHG